MKISTFNYRVLAVIIISGSISIAANAQLVDPLIKIGVTDTSKQLIKRILPDSSRLYMNMDANYNRPFVQVGKVPIAIGGYVEANTTYLVTNGIPAGFSFQFRRESIFLSSTIYKNISFLSEIEFEDGAEEIDVEYGALDIEFLPYLCLRGGIILNPIGSFNENHDGPKWDFIERPLEATTIIPTTLSTAGVGFHGEYFTHNWTLGYELYLTNGFNDNIISNADGRTSLADGDANPEQFVKSTSELPMFTGKIAVRNRLIGELGISYLTGVYNTWRTDDGLIVAPKRSASIAAIDFKTSQLKDRLNITTEFAKVFVQLPPDYPQNYGSQQFGGYIDFVGTVVQHKMLVWPKARINLDLRLEYVDYNQGTFAATGGKIYDNIWQITPGVAWRPVGGTVLRFNYIYSVQRDILGNLTGKTGNMEFGFSSYF